MAKRIIYPIYQLGNPQMRFFRPPFTMTLVRPGKEQPPDTVQFRIPMEYKQEKKPLKPAGEEARLQGGIRSAGSAADLPVPRYLSRDRKKYEEGTAEEMQEKFMEDERQRQKPDPRRGGVTEWFGL